MALFFFFLESFPEESASFRQEYRRFICFRHALSALSGARRSILIWRRKKSHTKKATHERSKEYRRYEKFCGLVKGLKCFLKYPAGEFLRSGAMTEGVYFQQPLPPCLILDVWLVWLCCRRLEIISSDFSINVERIIKDNFINCSFDLFFIFLIRKTFRSFCNSCQVTARIVTFFNVEQKPRSKLFKRIVRVVNCC